MTDYLTVAEVLAIHADQIERYGGARGVRDQGLLEAALYRPQTGYYAGLIEQAAALWAGWHRPLSCGVCDFPKGLVGVGSSSQSVHAEDRCILQEIKPPARPRPIPRGTDQAALHRIVVHVIQFLLAFLFAEDVERVESALPEAVVRFIMDRGRQPQPSEHLPAPGMLRVFAKRVTQSLCSSNSAAPFLMNVHSLLNMWTRCCCANLVFAERHA